ncbi:hypothetical protein BVRB_5g098690 [Beta vulgaris subsp. vulgaris]|nr:hypothetical protein BVRB_5g098690 [Beta vulgaris subsp. vulgaris]
MYNQDHPPHHEHEGQSKSFIAILFLILAIYLTLTYKSNEPSFSITAIRIPIYILSSTKTTATLSFAFDAVVTNPTRSAFAYSSTSAHLSHAGVQAGYMSIPGRRVKAGMENFMQVTINVKSLPITQVGNIPAKFGFGSSTPTIELELSVKIVGRLNVLWVFSRHVESAIDCRVIVIISDGTILSIQC